MPEKEGQSRLETLWGWHLHGEIPQWYFDWESGSGVPKKTSRRGGGDTLLVDPPFAVRRRRTKNTCCYSVLRLRNRGQCYIFWVKWMFLCSIRETLEGWKGPLFRKDLKKIWMAALHYAFLRQFGRKGIGLFLKMRHPQLKGWEILVFTLWSWAKTNLSVQALDVVDCLSSLATV